MIPDYLEFNMVRINRYQVMQVSKPLISKYFKQLKEKIYTPEDIQKIFNSNREEWRLLRSTKIGDFIKFIIENKLVKEIAIQMPNNTAKKRYIQEKVSIYKVALSIDTNTFLSHYTALYLHNLTDNIIKDIYTNKELTKKTVRVNKLIQENIDRAFSRPMRVSRQAASSGEYRIFLLNSKNFEKLGVIDFKKDGEVIYLTNIERTLIDAAVRPNYSGGVTEVLNAFKKAKGKFSVNKLKAMLKKMDYIYPYHQIIGFYLEKAGYEERLIKLFEDFEIKYNFYLTYRMKQKDFNDRWKLFFPKEF